MILAFKMHRERNPCSLLQGASTKNLTIFNKPILVREDMSPYRKEDV